MRNTIVFLFIIVCLSSCQNATQFPGFDTEDWKKDRFACNGTRTGMKGDFEKVRQKLKGLTQMEVVDVLGKPDLQRLDERNMKSYLYFLEPARTCTGGKNDAQVAILRFNAVDRVFEVTYEEGTPL